MIPSARQTNPDETESNPLKLLMEGSPIPINSKAVISSDPAYK